jgi:hypothetical protein
VAASGSTTKAYSPSSDALAEAAASPGSAAAQLVQVELGPLGVGVVVLGVAGGGARDLGQDGADRGLDRALQRAPLGEERLHERRGRREAADHFGLTPTTSVPRRRSRVVSMRSLRRLKAS